MRIGIDARFLTHPQRGGFKTYTENLITALAKIDSHNEYILYLDRSPDSNIYLPDKPNFSCRIVSGSKPMVGMMWREQFELPAQAKRDQLDLLHSLCLTAPLHLVCPIVITIHDMIWLFPGRFSKGRPWSFKRKLMEWYYRFVPKMVARRAAALITVSHAAKASIIQQLNIPHDQIYVTYEAASHIYSRVTNPEKLANIRIKYNLTSDFILSIGSADPRKNIKSIVQAYASLPVFLQERYHLVIIWNHTLFAEEMATQVIEAGLKSHVHFLQQVHDDELVLLYNAASLFVFPSRYEGFGLPPLEAMACGTPVIAANNSSIPEIVGDAAILTDAEDVSTMAELIAKVLADNTLQQDLTEKGLKRAASFSWEKCAYETLGVYHKVISQ